MQEGDNYQTEYCQNYLQSELVSLELELGSTSFILCNIKLAISVLMCLHLQNRYITKVVDISEIIEDVNKKISTIQLLEKKLLFE